MTTPINRNAPRTTSYAVVIFHPALAGFYGFRLRLIRIDRIINCRRLGRTALGPSGTLEHRYIGRLNHLPAVLRVRHAFHGCIQKLAPSMASESVGGDDADVFQTRLNLGQTRLQVGNDRKNGVALVLGDESVAAGVG